MTTPTFPNGYESFIDTFFQISCLIQNNYDENWNNDTASVVKQWQSFGGHSYLCELAHSWALQFERKYNTDYWIENDFYDTLESFFAANNKI